MVSPVEYEKAAVLAREIGWEMLSRLEWMTLKPRLILDAGCATGEMSLALQARYPDARVLGLDVDFSLLHHAKHLPSADVQYINAHADKLPFPDQSVDLIFANLVLPAYPDANLLLREWRRVLAPDGLLMMTALGLDTLQEWRAAYPSAELPVLMDMHDVGDLLLLEGLAEPVLDVDHYHMTYRDKNKLAHELYQSRITTAFAELEKMEVKAVNDTWEVSYEIIYAHAFAPPQTNEMTASADGVVRVPLSHLRKQLKA